MCLHIGYIFSLKKNRTFRAIINSADQIKNSGLTCTIWTDNAEHFPFIQRERDILNRFQSAKTNRDRFDV